MVRSLTLFPGFGIKVENRSIVIVLSSLVIYLVFSLYFRFELKKL